MLSNFNQIKFSLVRFYHASDPLTPESDLHLKSSYNFTRLKYHGQWNKGNDHQLKMLLIIKHILLVSTLENYREQCGENAKGC